MKKNFLLLCGLLLSVCGFVACSNDDAPAAPEPTFPELVTKTAEVGEVIELAFSANYDWTATISEETFAYFQLLDGETTTNTLSGEAGDQTIKVQVAEALSSESHVANVTLTMNGKSKVIAELTYPVVNPAAKTYAPILTAFGSFKTDYSTEGILYAYNEAEMTADDAIVMQWGTERGNFDDDDTFFAPVKVQANFAYTLAGPAWMAATKTGVAGVSESIVKADATKIPAETETATVEILSGEESVASFKITVPGANDFVPQLGFMPETSYAYDGEAIDGIDGEVIAGGFVKVVCAADGTAAEWLTLSEETLDEDAVIKRYFVTATAAENEESAARTAYVFYFAKNAAPESNADLFDESGEVKEEYENSLATVVTQYPEPATIEATKVDDTCAAFDEVGADFTSTWFFDDLRVYIGSKYDLNYFGESAIYGHEGTELKTSRPIASLTCYAYNDMGLLQVVQDVYDEEDNLVSAAWVSASVFGANNDTFNVQCGDLSLIPDSAKNPQNSEGEAVVLVEYTDGTYSAVYFHIGAGTPGADSGVAFANSSYAAQAQATLVELHEGDELYDIYFPEYSSTAMPAKFYHLTYEYPIEQNMYMMVELSGIPNTVYPNPICEWAYYNQQAKCVVMEPDGAGLEAPGVITFMNGSGINEIVILCTLNSAE